MFRMKIRHSSGLTFRAGGNHIDRDGDAGIVRIAELVQEVIGLLAGGLGRDFLAEIVAAVELLADDLYYIIRMKVRFCEHQGLGDFSAAGEDFGEEPLLERANDKANLVDRHHVAVEVAGRVGQVVVEAP